MTDAKLLFIYVVREPIVTLRVLAPSLEGCQHIIAFPVFLSLKASSLKGTAVQAITRFGENTTAQAHGQSEI